MARIVRLGVRRDDFAYWSIAKEVWRLIPLNGGMDPSGSTSGCLETWCPGVVWCKGAYPYVVFAGLGAFDI